MENRRKCVVKMNNKNDTTGKRKKKIEYEVGGNGKGKKTERYLDQYGKFWMEREIGKEVIVDRKKKGTKGKKESEKL